LLMSGVVLAQEPVVSPEPEAGWEPMFAAAGAAAYYVPVADAWGLGGNVSLIGYKTGVKYDLNPRLSVGYLTVLEDSFVELDLTVDLAFPLRMLTKNVVAGLGAEEETAAKVSNALSGRAGVFYGYRFDGDDEALDDTEYGLVFSIGVTIEF